MSDVPIDRTPDPAAVVAENQELRNQLDKYEGEKRVKRVRLRKILVGILVVLTCSRSRRRPSTRGRIGRC